MYQMAKTAREKMKAKARSLASEKDQKVDSSDWSPAKPLNADVKTGARPIMKPSSKGIGESNAARDTKAAIGKDLKRGAFKSGGAVKDAGVKDKKALGAIDPSPKRGAAGHYKKGGKIRKRANGGGLPSPEESMRSAERLGEVKATEKKPARATSDSRTLPPPGEAMGRSGKFQDYKKGGRTGRATGGLINALKGGKKARGKGAKTDINIVINAGHKAPARHPAAGLMPPPDMGAGAPPPMPPVGAGAPAAPPMLPPGGPMSGPGLPIGRKAGGRITKVASSYKDLTAGSGSGLGREQKTSIAEKHKGAPTKAAGGKISKTASSYRDLTAGSGSGIGRLQKESIAEKKKGAPTK